MALDENKYNVKVGQIWKNNDPRLVTKRYFKILDIYLNSNEISKELRRSKCFWPPDAYAYVIEVDVNGYRIFDIGYSFIKLHRFNGHKNGYSLYKDIL